MNGKLNIQSAELDKCVYQRRKDSEKLFDFINTKVHPKIRKRLINLIETYYNDCSDYTTIENMLHYKLGFSTAIKAVISSFKI